MRGQHESGKGKLTGSPKKGKNRFANILVTLCLVVVFLVDASVVWEYHRLGVPIPSDVLAEIFGVITAALGIVAGRQGVGADALKWLKKDKSSPESGGTDDNSYFGGNSI